MDLGMIPPFWFEGKWVMLDEDSAYFFVLPSVVTLFRTWRRAVGSLCKVLPGVSWNYLKQTQFVTVLGPRFLRPGVSGCFGLPSCVFSDLAEQFPSSRCLRSLRLPDFL